MIRKARQRFWLTCMDALFLCGRFGGAAYLYCLTRASDCNDWGTE